MTKEEIFKLIKENTEKEGFITHNNIKVKEIKDNYAEVYVDVTEKSLNPYGTIHGGLLFGLADTVIGIAATTNGKPCVTINSQIDYLRPGKGKKIIAKAEKVKVGKTTAVYRCNIFDEKETLIATAIATYIFTS